RPGRAAGAPGPGDGDRLAAGAGGPGGGAVLRGVRALPARPAARPRLRFPEQEPPPAARPRERAAVVRVLDAGQGLLLGRLHGGLRPVPRLLPPGPARAAVAGPGPVRGVP